MKKVNRLSHSSVSKWQQCPKLWYYHYEEKLRPKYQSGALFFGSAIDNAINALLKKEGKDPYEIFDYNWKFGRIDGQDEKEFLATSNKIVFSNTDYDKELLTDDDIEELKKHTLLNTKDEVLDYYKVLSDLKKRVSWNNVSVQDQKLYNHYNWLSLRRKGHLIIKAYEDEIMPNIVKVHAVQKYIKLQNTNGDSIIGYIDAILDYKHNGRVQTVVFDLKTSSIDYADDAVINSPQLSLYLNAVKKEYNTRVCGFLVAKKQIDKNRVKVCSRCAYDGSGARHKTCSNLINGVRCEGEWIETIKPSVNFQIIINEIPQQTENIVMENYQDIADTMKLGKYTRNFNSCEMPWGPCPMKAVCFKNDYSEVNKIESKK